MNQKRASAWTVNLEHSKIFPLTPQTIERLYNEKNDEIPRKWYYWMVESFDYFCDITSVHGFPFVYRDTGTLNERRGWAFIVLLFSILSIATIWVAFVYNIVPLTVTVAETHHYSSWNIPFPAVTICNFNQISMKRAKNLSEQLKIPAGQLIPPNNLTDLFRIVMSGKGFLNVNEKNYSDLNEILSYNNMTLNMLREQIAPNCNEMQEKCMWRGTVVKCEILFQKINSVNGVCCSFNYYGLDKNNFPKQIAQQIPKLPRQVSGSGHQTGLLLILNPKVDDYFGSFSKNYGFQIYLHDSYDFPDQNAETKMITLKTVNYIRINPETVYSTENIRYVRLYLRECYFPDEFTLKTMQKYSFINCMAECRSELFYKICGCIPSGLPIIGKIEICEIDKIQCVLKNQYKIYSASLLLNGTIHSDQLNCWHCLPDCERNFYPSDINNGNLDLKYNLQPFFRGVKENNKIVVYIYYNDLISTKVRTDIYETWLDKFTVFGGLTGCTIGFSVVSGIEIVYYFTLRPLYSHFCSQLV